MKPLDIQSLHANYQPFDIPQYQPQSVQAPHKAPGGLAGFLINNLPSIAGGVGLVGGELLDPFGGGLVTGGAASAAGEALKRKLLGESFSPKQMAIQAGETDLLGGIGKGFTAAKAGSKALLRGGAPVASDIAGTATKPAVINRVGNYLVDKGAGEESSLGGYAVGQKVGGDKLGTAASQKIAQTLQDQGINGLTAKTAQAQIEAKLADLNKARESLYTIHNTALAQADKKALTDAVTTSLSKSAGGSTPTVKNLADTYIKEALGQGDLNGLAKYKTSLDDNLINWNRNPASVEPGAQIAAGAVRSALKDFLQNKVPGLSAIDKPYSSLSTANEALKTAAGRTANLSTGGGGIWSHILGGETAEGVKGVLAKGFQAGGKALGGKATASTAAKDVLGTAKPTLTAGVSGLNVGTDAAPSLGRLAAGSEARAGVNAATSQALDAQTYNRLAKEYIQNLADQSAKRGTLLGESGNGGMLVRPGATPSFASLGIEPKPIPSLPFAPKGSLLKTATGITPTIRGTETFDRLAREQALQSLAGQGGGVGLRGQIAGRTVAPILAKPGATTAAIAKQGIGRAVGGAVMTGGDGNNQPQDLSTALAQAGIPIDQSQTQTSGNSASQSPYPIENALYDISRDPKNAATYEALYKFANPVDNSQALDATQQKEVSASQTAIARIQQYGQQLAGASGGNVASGSLATVLGKYVPFASQSDKNAAALQSSQRDVAIQLATALMGGNKPSAQSVDEIEKSLPSVNDSPQLRQAKINAIVSGLQSNLRNYATPVSQITSGLGYGNTTNGDVGSQLNSVLSMLGQQ